MLSSEGSDGNDCSSLWRVRREHEYAFRFYKNQGRNYTLCGVPENEMRITDTAGVDGLYAEASVVGEVMCGLDILK